MEEVSELSHAIKDWLVEVESSLSGGLAKLKGLFQMELECTRAAYERKINSLKQQIETMNDDLIFV